jgi:hypothetical protein
MTKLTVTELLVEKKITEPNTNSNSQFSKTQYPIPNTNNQNPIAIEIVKKSNSIAIVIGYWVLVLHVDVH